MFEARFPLGHPDATGQRALVARLSRKGFSIKATTGGDTDQPVTFQNILEAGRNVVIDASRRVTSMAKGIRA